MKSWSYGGRDASFGALVTLLGSAKLCAVKLPHPQKGTSFSITVEWTEVGRSLLKINRQRTTDVSYVTAEDGQCMYLHPVNVRCLVREYGSLEKSPEKITAAVVEIAGYSMTEVVILLPRFSSLISDR